MIRVLVTMPEEYKKAFQTAAAKEGQSLSDWMRCCCCLQLEATEIRGLPEITETRGRPPGD